MALVSGGTCTGGFWTQSQADELKYILTAGHCFVNGEGATWYAEHTTSTPLIEIGPGHNAEFAGTDWDVGIVRVLGTSQFAGSDPGLVVVTRNTSSGTTRDEMYEIRRVRRTPRRRRVCTTSATPNFFGRHTVCGRVVRRNFRWRAEGETTRHTTWSGHVETTIRSIASSGSRSLRDPAADRSIRVTPHTASISAAETPTRRLRVRLHLPRGRGRRRGAECVH